jgi:hypothetical protein
MTRNPTRREIDEWIERLNARMGAAADGFDIEMTDYLVIPRSQAEAGGREILGPATTPTDGDHVRVPMSD